jgi:hypothetical protein
VRRYLVVLSLAATWQAKLSPLELVLGAAIAHGHSAPAKISARPAGHDLSATAKYRLHLAVRQPRAVSSRPARRLVNDGGGAEFPRFEVRPC